MNSYLIMYALTPHRIDCNIVTNSVKSIAHITDKSLSIQGLARCLSLVTYNEWEAQGLKTPLYAIENTI
ncbi:MAG: hypothetical protein M3N42_11520 [Cyanobacteriota bacterium]|nr:hypothetical protein [Cyanobacteriota bacterium]